MHFIPVLLTSFSAVMFKCPLKSPNPEETGTPYTWSNPYIVELSIRELKIKEMSIGFNYYNAESAIY